MPTVDLVYDVDCPHISLARMNLTRALAECGLEARWHEHVIGAPDAPPRIRGFGSPTILVDGTDVARSEPGAEACCRIYNAGSGTTGAPPVELIAEALRAVRGTP